jgi:hypothetical protein
VKLIADYTYIYVCKVYDSKLEESDEGNFNYDLEIRHRKLAF